MLVTRQAGAAPSAGERGDLGRKRILAQIGQNISRLTICESHPMKLSDFLGKRRSVLEQNFVRIFLNTIVWRVLANFISDGAVGTGISVGRFQANR